MGIFTKLFKKATIQIASPASGEAVSITTVSDETFAREILGKGVAILPAEGKFYAPADGELVSMFATGHAYAVRTPEGAEVMVHIGFDTVKLKGEHFTAYAKEGDQVQAGDLLLEVDLEAIKAKGYDITTPVIILNSAEFETVEPVLGKRDVGDTLLSLTKKV